MCNSGGSSLCGVVFAAIWICTVGVGILELKHINSFNVYDGR